MMKTAYFLTLFVSPLFFTTANTHAQVQSLEELIGLSIAKEGIEFTVKSSGCTTKENFKIDVAAALNQKISLIRVNDDHCDEAQPFGTKLTYSYDELQVKPTERFSVLNRVGGVRPIKVEVESMPYTGTLSRVPHTDKKENRFILHTHAGQSIPVQFSGAEQLAFAGQMAGKRTKVELKGILDHAGLSEEEELEFLKVMHFRRIR